MVKDRLITGAFLAAGLLSTVSFDPVADDDGSPDEGEHWRRFSERCASDSLKTLSPAEADFVADDHGSNRAEDFWTADVAGLYATSPDPCDHADPSAATCASAFLAETEEGWTPAVAGQYRMTSAAMVMPGTGHALRLMEFTVGSKDEEAAVRRQGKLD